MKSIQDCNLLRLYSKHSQLHRIEWQNLKSCKICNKSAECAEYINNKIANVLEKKELNK